MKEELEKYHLEPNKVNKENSKFLLDKTELFFDGIFLNDIILRKDFSRLEEQLDKFYSINYFTFNDYKNRNLSNFLNDNNHRGKIFLPMISSKEHSFHKNKDLPEDIDFIQINLEKVCLDYISIDIIFDRLTGIIELLKFDTTEFIRIKKFEKYENNFDKINIDVIKTFISKKSLLINKTILNINSLFELKNTTENMNLQTKVFWLTISMFLLVLIQVLLIKIEEKYIYDFIFNIFK